MKPQKVEYPSWAPPVLIERHKDEEELFLSIERQNIQDAEQISAMTDEEWCESSRFQLDQTLFKRNISKQAYLRNNEETTKHFKERLSYFRRLVFDERAREIWETIGRHKNVSRVVIESKDEEIGGYPNICLTILERAEKFTCHTPAEKREHLENIAKMAKELQGVIRQSPYFNERLWMSRQLNGGKFSVSPSVTLETILDWLSKDATDMAKAPPVVSQAKGKNATRNHFIREMYAMHKHIYGKPLWDMLAASANVMFNLSAKDSLSADDIRPLIQ